MDYKVLNLNNEGYPRRLRSIENPPSKLYILGNEKILNDECLSIIGSRHCTEYGAEIARNFARKLAKSGITIVSGMAQGIDSEAHLGALDVGGRTIAVLGSGFNHIFPDKEVYNKILANNGAVITEYEEDVDVFAQGFRDRNRIVAGLSSGTLVVEAKKYSGTGITAEYVNKFNRHLFCIPHAIDDEAGVGTNRLLKRGAKLATCVEDILEYYNGVQEIENNGMIVEVPEEYKSVFEHIEKTPINGDEICKKTKLNISEVNTILTMLELEGFIEILPGNYYKRRVI